MKYIILILLFNVVIPINATIYHLSPDGSDKKGLGTSEFPWKCISYAINKVSEGDTLFLDEGEYIEKQQLKLPSGISIIGSGIDKTIIRSKYYFTIEKWEVNVDKFLFKVENSQNVCFRNFTLDGDSRSAYGGMFIDNTSYVSIHEIKLSNFNFCGLYWNNSENIEMSNFIVENCAWPNYNGCSGAIMIGNIRNGTIHDGLVMEDSGYGIKTNISTWVHPHKLEAAILENVDVYNIHFDMEPYGAWFGGIAPNFCLEYWNVVLRDCRIFNCYFNTCISLPSSPKNKNGKTVEIFNNDFIMEFKPGVPSCAMEAGCPDMHIHHNYFKGGYYPLASFGGPVIGHKIHHNIFDDIWGISIIQHNGVENSIIENNTFYVRNDLTFLKSKKIDNVRISNNLFYCNKYYNHSPLLNSESIKNVDVVDNWFYNWTPTGYNYLEGDPELNLRGDDEWSIFAPNKKGNMYNRGYIKGAITIK